MNLLIIGQNPGVMRSTDPREVPIHKTLYRWCDKLGIKYYSFVNVQHRMGFYKPTGEELAFLTAIVKIHRPGPILVLGRKAWLTMKILYGNNRAGAMLAPHPSGLNRQFNDHRFEEIWLVHVERYLREKLIAYEAK